MRERSSEQARASRKNGSKSRGPKSSAGKRRSAQNAIQDGIFSRRVVIEQLGEKQQDFENLTKSYLDIFQPSSELEEKLILDFVENLWRRDRVRWAEQQELSSRIELLRLRNDLETADEMETLIGCFLNLFEAYVTGQDDPSLHFPNELENARRELVSTIGGVDFFLQQLEVLQTELEAEGRLSKRQKMLLLVICGTGTAWIGSARMSRLTVQKDDHSNSTINTQSSDENNQFAPDLSSAKSESEGEKYEDKTISAEPDFVKLTTATQIEVAAEQLCARKEKLQMIEAAAAPSRILMAIIDPNTSDRFSLEPKLPLNAECTTPLRVLRSFGEKVLQISSRSPRIPGEALRSGAVLVYDSPRQVGIGNLQNEPGEDACDLSGTQFYLSALEVINLTEVRRREPIAEDGSVATRVGRKQTPKPRKQRCPDVSGLCSISFEI